MLVRLDERSAGRRGTFVWTLALTLIAVTVAVAVASVRGTPNWSSDSLFYWAQMLELQGENAQESRRIVFSTQEAQDVAAVEDRVVERVLDPAWVEYSAQFYRRRWTVPAIAAAIEPWAEKRALTIAGTLGYVAFAPFVFILLRQRFRPLLSAGTTSMCLLLPPVLKWGVGTGGTDAWGLALLTASLLAAVLVLDRGLVWLPAWVVSMAALSVTRDATIVAGAAVLWVILAAWLYRDKNRRRSGLR